MFLKFGNPDLYTCACTHTCVHTHSLRLSLSTSVPIVVSNIMSPKDAYALLHPKMQMDFADVIRLMTLKMGRLFLIVWVAQSNHKVTRSRMLS